MPPTLPPPILDGPVVAPGDIPPPDLPIPKMVEPQGPQLPDDNYLLDMFQEYKQACFDTRWVWEREWLRDVYYVLGRQWIQYHPSRREWIDKRFSRRIPRPVTNKISEVVQAVRANFGEISLGIACRPIGNSTSAIASAEIADLLAPLIHTEHDMDRVLQECDFWQLVTGTACIQLSWDNDKRFNRNFIQAENCMVCGTDSMPADVMQANNACPVCGNPQLQPAVDNSSGQPQPKGEWVGQGRGKTSALSPFEYAIPSEVVRLDETPYLIRVRWRDKSYYEANYPDLARTLQFERSPSDTSLQIYKALSVASDASGVTTGYLSSGSGYSQNEGITEYELWLRPTDMFPNGLVMRVVGDSRPQIVHDDREGLPGPFPYTDIEGLPIFPFASCSFEQFGGRFYGRSLIAPLIKKQDQINQLDSLIQQTVQRMANPVWIIPEGAGIDNFTGDPGLVLRWNPLAANGLAKPERISAENVPPGLHQLRSQYIQDFEDLSGAFDIFRGDRQVGVEAFSAMNLLVERSQARFTSAWKDRGEMYRKWYEMALELERQFGPEKRAMTLVGHNKSYTYRHFEKAQLQGNVTVAIEDGTNIPKTALGRRANIEHLNQLGMINPGDPGQRYTILSLLGMSEVDPGLDVHVQASLKMQDDFEQWVENPVGPHPLILKPWHNPMVHKAERMKWLNTDTMRQLLKRIPQIEPIIIQHLMEIDMVGAQQLPPGGVPESPMPPLPGQGPILDAQMVMNNQQQAGAGRAMANANANAGAPTGTQNAPAQPQGLVNSPNA